MSIPQEIGRNIVFMRGKIGVTQEWLSLETEIAGSYLREIEHGRANPTIDVLGRIAQALQIPLDLLVTEGLEQNYDRYFPDQEFNRVLFTEVEVLFLHYILKQRLCSDCQSMVETERQRFKKTHQANDISLLSQYMGRR